MCGVVVVVVVVVAVAFVVVDDDIVERPSNYTSSHNKIVVPRADHVQ